MADRVIQRNDTAARWQSINPVLATGEIGIEIDGAKGYKIGDGKTRWNDLPYPANPTNVVQEVGDNENAVMSQKAVSAKLSELGSELSRIDNDASKNVYTSSDFAGLFYGGDGVYSANANYNGIVVVLKKGVNYSINGNFVSVTSWSNFPTIGSTNGYVRRINTNDFTCENNENYLLISVETSFSSITLVSKGGKLQNIESRLEDVSEMIEDVVPEMQEEVSNISIIVGGDSETKLEEDGEGLLWNGTEWVSSSSYVSFIVFLAKGRMIEYTYSGALQSGRFFEKKPSVSVIDNKYADIKSGYIAPIDLYAVFTFDITTGYPNPSVNVSLSAFGLFGSMQKIERDIEGHDKIISNLYVKESDIEYSDFANLTYGVQGAENLYIGVAGYNGIIVPLIERATYQVKSTISSAFTFSDKPAYQTPISDAVRRVDKNIFTASANEKYLFVTLQECNAPLIVHNYGEGIYMPFYTIDDIYKNYSLKGKNIVFFGDSLVQGVGASRMDMAYPMQLAAMYQCNVINGGIGGTRISKRALTGGNSQYWQKLDLPSLIDAVNIGDWSEQEDAANALNAVGDTAPALIIRDLKKVNWDEIDAIVINAGSNDWTSGVVFGQRDSLDVSEFNGGINYAIKVFNTKYPKIKVIFSTCLSRFGNSVADSEWGEVKSIDGHTLRDFTNEMMETTHYHSIPCYDLYKECGFSKYNFMQFSNDGAHLRDEGYERVARQVGKYVLTLL